MREAFRDKNRLGHMNQLETYLADTDWNEWESQSIDV